MGSQRSAPEDVQLTSDSVITYTYACAYLQTGGRHIMVDAGFHAHEVVEALATAGVSPEQIDWVLITHGDGDHVVGLLTAEEKLTFPNAQIVMSLALWKHWNDDQAMGDLSDENRAFYAHLVKRMEDRVTLFTEEAEIDSGIRFIPSPGHRHGHSIYQFQTEDTPILHAGDTFFHPIFIEHPHWMDRMSLDPERERSSRQRALERSSSLHALVLTGHMPFPGMGTIRKQGDVYRWHPLTG